MYQKMDVKHVGAAYLCTHTQRRAAAAADKCCTTVACRLVQACYQIVTTGILPVAGRQQL
jgi:hypothetical protein